MRPIVAAAKAVQESSEETNEPVDVPQARPSIQTVYVTVQVIYKQYCIPGAKPPPAAFMDAIAFAKFLASRIRTFWDSISPPTTGLTRRRQLDITSVPRTAAVSNCELAASKGVLLEHAGEQAQSLCISPSLFTPFFSLSLALQLCFLSCPPHFHLVENAVFMSPSPLVAPSFFACLRILFLSVLVHSGSLVSGLVV